MIYVLGYTFAINLSLVFSCDNSRIDMKLQSQSYKIEQVETQNLPRVRALYLRSTLGLHFARFKEFVHVEIFLHLLVLCQTLFVYIYTCRIISLTSKILQQADENKQCIQMSFE